LEDAKEALSLASSSDSKAANLATTIVIAYYNIGTELEHLRKFGRAKSIYEKGYSYSTRELGETHPLSESLAENLERVGTKFIKS
jgi:hypothetical protein